MWGKAADHREQFIKPATVCSVYVGISRENETEDKRERKKERQREREREFMWEGERRKEGERDVENTETKGIQDVQEACGG